MSVRRRASAVVGAVTAVLTVGALALPVPESARAARLANAARPEVACHGNPGTVHGIWLPDRGVISALPARPRMMVTRDHTGEYVAPAGRPKGLVAFAHGHGHSILSWTWILRHVAAEGYIAVAMEYPGTTFDDPKVPDYAHQTGTPTSRQDYERGWQVREGATQLIAAARQFESACPGLTTIIDYGVSMGGNTSGLIAEARARRRDGTPLFNLWFDIEGVTNLTEEYLGARGLANSGSSSAATAVGEIEHEAGGALEQHPRAYDALTVTAHAAEIRASGIRGVVMVHALDDGLVPTDQTQQMAVALSRAGVPVDVTVIGRRAPGSDSNDTTIDGYVPVAHTLPFAGHGFEGSHTQTVISTGLTKLDSILHGGAWPHGSHEHFLDGALGPIF
jgi:hypothetical protein